MRLNFLGVGVQKAGTSTLHDILKNHSQIFLPPSKEAHFFDLSERYEKGTEWLWKTFFTEYNNQAVIGKFTPEYLYFESVPKRIFETFGTDIKFIVVFRNPVERAISHYNMTYRRGMEEYEFWDAVKHEKMRIQKTELDKVHYSYISRGYYAQQLKNYLQYFPLENFLLLTFENDIVNNLNQTLIKIQNFLGVNIEDLNSDVKSNEGFNAGSVSVNKFLKKNELVKKIGKIIFPNEKSRKALMSRFYQFNRSKKKTLQFSLTKQEKQNFFDEYFMSETKELEAITKMNFNSVWY